MKKINLMEIIKENFNEMSYEDISKIAIYAERLGLELKIVINDEKVFSRKNSGIIRTLDFEGINQLTHLKSLKVMLFNEYINVEEIGELKQLEELSLIDHTLYELSFLKDLKELKVLRIPRFSKREEDPIIIDIGVVSNFKELKELIFGSFKIKDLSPIKNCIKLEILDLISSHIVEIESVERLEKLKTLKLSINKELESIEGIKNLKSLEILDLSHMRRKIHFKEIGELTNLRELDLSCNKAIINLEDFIQLKNIEKICLDLSLVVNFSAIKNLVSLKELRLETVKTIDDFTAIGELANLETLILRKNRQLTNIDFLAGLKKLNHLEVYECGKIQDYSVVKSVNKVVK